MEIIQEDLAYTEDRAALEAVLTSVFKNISLVYCCFIKKI